MPQMRWHRHDHGRTLCPRVACGAHRRQGFEAAGRMAGEHFHGVGPARREQSGSSARRRRRRPARPIWPPIATGTARPCCPAGSGARPRTSARLIGAFDDGRCGAVEDGFQVGVVGQVEFRADAGGILREAAAAPDARAVVLEDEHGAARCLRLAALRSGHPAPRSASSASSMPLMAWASAWTRAVAVVAPTGGAGSTSGGGLALLFVQLRLPHGLDQGLLGIRQRGIGVLAELGAGRRRGCPCPRSPAGRGRPAGGRVRTRRFGRRDRPGWQSRPAGRWPAVSWAASASSCRRRQRRRGARRTGRRAGRGGLRPGG